MEVLHPLPAQSSFHTASRLFIGNGAVGKASPTGVRSCRRRAPRICSELPFFPSKLVKTGLEIPSKVLEAVLEGGDFLHNKNPSNVAGRDGRKTRQEHQNRSNGTGGGAEKTPSDYMREILLSDVYSVANETPLHKATKLSENLGFNVFLKREDTHPVYSFKLRGAYNMMSQIPRKELDKGVITASSGNHAQGVALSAQRLDCNAIICMPETTPAIKIQAVERLGGTVKLVGDTFDDAQAYAMDMAKDQGLHFIPPFDHPDIIAGQGTIGMEIMRQSQGPIEAVFVPVGGGGLIAGIATFIKTTMPEVKIIGVEPYDSNAMYASLEKGERITLDTVGSFADGVAVKQVGEENFRLCKDLIDGVILVTQDAISASIKDVFEETRSILEPAGALALAGAQAYCKLHELKDVNVVAVLSGSSMNFDTLRQVAERADVGKNKEAVLATYLPELPGSFKRFSELVGSLSITEFNYRFNPDEERAVTLYRVSHSTKEELDEMLKRLESSGLETIDLTNNDLAKDHLRNLVGGREKVDSEVLARFVFPEKAGALNNFLDAMSPRWNISLFNYRAKGDYGSNVLVGLQVPDSEMDDFHLSANNLGYTYKVESNNIALKLLSG